MREAVSVRVVVPRDHTMHSRNARPCAIHQQALPVISRIDDIPDGDTGCLYATPPIIGVWRAVGAGLLLDERFQPILDGLHEMGKSYGRVERRMRKRRLFKVKRHEQGERKWQDYMT